jgi:ribosomal protein S18 acetylase RimI-like enzyme
LCKIHITKNPADAYSETDLDFSNSKEFQMNDKVIRVGYVDDFENINNLAGAAIIPAFESPLLSKEQRTETTDMISRTQSACLEAMEATDKTILVGEVNGALAGFVIINHASTPIPEIRWMIVFVEFQGSGIAKRLMESALECIGEKKDVMLGVVHFNERAIHFYRKFGFEIIGDANENYAIQRLLMKRNGS